MIRRPPRSTHCISSAASDVYKRQVHGKSLTDITEAEAALKQGRKCLKSLFFLRPNYLDGFAHFKNASETFAKAARYDEAIECYEGLSLCGNELNDLFSAAEAKKALAYIYLEQKKDPEKAEREIGQCVEFLKLQGKMEKVQWVLTEFAKRSLKAGFIKLAEKTFDLVISAVFDEDNYLDGVAIIWEYLDYLIDNSRFSKALELYKRHIEYTKDKKKYNSTTAKCYLCIVAIHIILKEPYIAEAKLQELEANNPDLLSSPYYEIAVKLIEAVNSQDEKAFKKTLMIPMMSQLERNLLRALKKVNIVQKTDAKQEVMKTKDSEYGGMFE
eukprot:TRINITY_DN11234_c0_g1_i3.p2 TRINITY_DN11234_c0_g1~~TRINITY_DN11234_c0_g1_i3.p2  ORF type:complete len:336 (+),score=88.80 TRINITY_DN11234_c0_g1_i3:25-1008(+)